MTCSQPFSAVMADETSAQVSQSHCTGTSGHNARPGLRSRPKESYHDYPHVVVRDGRRRVIVCADGIQWIVQRLGGDQWNGVGYWPTAGHAASPLP